MSKPCTECGSTNHTRFSCPRRPRTALNTTKPLKAKKRMKQWGAHAAKWQKTRAEWFRQNPADTYHCYICGKPLSRDEVTLDHKLSRGRHPALRYESSNLAPCCWSCNELKGSYDIDEYLEKLKLQKEA